MLKMFTFPLVLFHKSSVCFMHTIFFLTIHLLFRKFRLMQALVLLEAEVALEVEVAEGEAVEGEAVEALDQNTLNCIN